MKRRNFLSALLSLLPFSLSSKSALGYDLGWYDTVEEDWQLVITTTNTNTTCPQITTMMYGEATSSSPVPVFNMNYRDYPSYQAGGLQTKMTTPTTTVVSVIQRDEQLQTDNETITWTQQLNLANGTLTFEITQGTSTTWGPFGGPDEDELLVSYASSASWLDYDPDVSVANSFPSFGANLVTSMTLVQVRYFRKGNLIKTDTTQRSVDLA